MKAAPFEYSRVADIDEACALLAADDGARVIAGGQTLVPMMAMRLARPTRLIDIDRIAALSYIRLEGDALAIGAATRQMPGRARCAGPDDAAAAGRAIPHIGHAATRARGTVGGSIANADPAAELPLIAVTLDATLHVRDGGRQRTLPARDFFVGPMVTALPAGACLTAVRFPVWRGDARRRLPRGERARAATSPLSRPPRRSRWATTARAKRIAIGVGAVTDFPLRLDGAERRLPGTALADDAVRAAVARRSPASRRSPTCTPPPPTAAASPLTLAARAVADARARARGDRRMRIKLDVNGERSRDRIEPRTTLLDCLRDNLGLNGAHAGCEHGVCGACTVLFDGEPVRSCLMFAAQAEGYAITTVEGVSAGPRANCRRSRTPSARRTACNAATARPAMVLVAHALLAGNPEPTREEIVDAISGNICRCTGYAQIVEAIALAAERLRGDNRPAELRMSEPPTAFASSPASAACAKTAASWSARAVSSPTSTCRT